MALDRCDDLGLAAAVWHGVESGRHRTFLAAVRWWSARGQLGRLAPRALLGGILVLRSRKKWQVRLAPRFKAARAFLMRGFFRLPCRRVLLDTVLTLPVFLFWTQKALRW